MREITVLVTAAGNVFMHGTLACLKNNGERPVRVIGADMNDDPTMLQMADACYQVPRGDDPRYVDVLLDICRKEHVDVLLPIMSVELNVLAENRHRFAEIGTKVSVSDLEPLAIANNKRTLLDFLVQQGLPCAGYRAVRTVEALTSAAYELGYPEKRVCVKATQGSGSRGFRILDAHVSKLDLFLHQKPTAGILSLEELLSIFEGAQMPELLVMEYLPGDEYTVDLLADHGRVLYNCCRRSTNMENSIMLDGVVVNNEAVLSLCAAVVEKLGLDGNIGFDLRDRADGTPRIMECNPRITAGIPAFAAAGVNLPYLCVKKLLGEPLPEAKVTEGLTMKRRYLEMYTRPAVPADNRILSCGEKI